MVSGHPPDAHDFNRRVSNGEGLLHRNGLSIDNNVDGMEPTRIVGAGNVYSVLAGWL